MILTVDLRKPTGKGKQCIVISHNSFMKSFLLISVKIMEIAAMTGAIEKCHAAIRIGVSVRPVSNTSHSSSSDNIEVVPNLKGDTKSKALQNINTVLDPNRWSSIVVYSLLVVTGRVQSVV
ncbi:hypothetical protein C0J52_19945 [Blattella germanica]|nr:hypothetical protein C0J52_19945 [Blattella germanica]